LEERLKDPAASVEAYGLFWVWSLFMCLKW